MGTNYFHNSKTKFENKHLVEEFNLDFSVGCFCGFLLHY